MVAADYTHSPTPEEIMEYLDGEGTAAARSALEAHLALCGTCRAVASEQRQLSTSVRGWQMAAAPASLRPPAATWRRRVLPLRMPAWRPSRNAIVAVAAAAAVLLAAFVGRPDGRPQSSASPASTNVGAVPEGSAASVIEQTTEPLGSGRAASFGDATSSGRGMAGGVDSAARYARMPPSPSRGAAQQAGTPSPANLQDLSRPSVIRTGTLRIVVKEFEGVRLAVERLVTSAGGFIDQMTVTGDAGSPRALRGSLRIPADAFAEVSDQVRRLGQVVEDTQGSQDVSDQLIDLGARLASARATERRLTELLRERTGGLSDVLDVERELARVRIEIERLDASTTNLNRRVSYATLTVHVAEERKAGLDPGPWSLASRIRVATADGIEAALESAIGLLLSILRGGPRLLLWVLVLTPAGLLGRWLWRARSGDSRVQTN
jgi:hypothetical protein